MTSQPKDYEVLGMLEVLCKCKILERKGISNYFFEPKFDFKLRQNFRKVLQEQKQLEAIKTEEYFTEAFIQTLKDYGFFNRERSEEEVVLAVNVLETFLKDDLKEKMMKTLGE